jgi:hypothetical protein
MAFKKVEKGGNLFKFERAGDAVEGILMKIRRGETQFGEAQFADIDTKDGRVSVVITAGLGLFDWDSMINKMIRIEYTGDKKNSKTGRYFKDFDVYVDEDYIPFE